MNIEIFTLKFVNFSPLAQNGGSLPPYPLCVDAPDNNQQLTKVQPSVNYVLMSAKQVQQNSSFLSLSVDGFHVSKTVPNTTNTGWK